MNSKNFHQTMGKISRFSDQVYWTIPKFNDLPKNYCFRSPSFDFMGSTWRLLLWNSKEWIEIGIELLSLVPQEKIVKFGIKGSSLEISKIHDVNDLPHKFPMITRSAVKNHGNDWLPDGDIFLFLAMGHDSKAISISQVKSNCGLAACERTGQNAWKDASVQTEDEIGRKRLEQDFKELLLNGNSCDLILKVGDQQFKSHKCILAVRSPVLFSMANHETKENNTDVFVIQDSDPENFSDFLQYLYTGFLENPTLEKVQKLYIIAKKYEVKELQLFCIDYMAKNISVDSFCDILNLSLQHEEKNLTDECHNFFANNSLAVVLTSKWKTFLKENPVAVNEIFINHFQNNK